MRAKKTKEPPPRPGVTVAVVLLSPASGELAVFLKRAVNDGVRARWGLPQDTPRGDETLDHAAQRIARGSLHGGPSWMEQLATFSNPRRQATQSPVTVAYLGLVPQGEAAPTGSDAALFALERLPALMAPQGEIVKASLAGARERMDHAPIAFRLLPTTFTLGELQSLYEILLGRNIHKASFRRALQAAWLVEPTDEWRSEGRGRPAQLYRYAPRKRRSSRRALRFDRLG